MEPVLSMLSETEYISGERLCERLGMTRAAVWKRVQKLREEGYNILSAGKRGYLLQAKPDSLLPGYLLRGYLRRMEKAVEALEKEGLPAILPEYARRSVTLGRAVQVTGIHEGFVGVANSLDDTGALWVRDEQGKKRRVLSGDVSVRGVMGYVET